MAITLTSRLIDEDIVNLLRQCNPIENIIPKLDVSMDRGTYTRFNNILSDLGGKWVGRKTQAHVFPEGTDVEELLAYVIENGHKPDKNPCDFYATPAAAADTLIDRLSRVISANYSKGDEVTILEPSAGDGDLLAAYRRGISDGKQIPGVCWIEAYEIDSTHYKKISDEFFLMGNDSRTYTIMRHSFLENFHPFPKTCPKGFEIVLMNPPFGSPDDMSAWVDHFLKAFIETSPGGAIAAILPTSYIQRNTKRIVALRELIEDFSSVLEIENLPEGSFKESGTAINTLTVIAEKAFDADLQDLANRARTIFKNVNLT